MAKRRTARGRPAVAGRAAESTDTIARPGAPADDAASAPRSSTGGVEGRRPGWRPLVAIVALWMTLFAPQLFLGQVFVLGDAREYRPYAEFSRARWIESRERTTWNPYVFAGIAATASLADPRPQYLPDWGIDLYERIRMPKRIPLAGPLLAHLAGMLATGLLAFALWRVGPTGIVVAGAAFGLMPNLVVPFVFGHGAQFVTASLMPVVLLMLHLVFAAERFARAGVAALGLALALGLQVLTGHPQLVVYSAMLASAFAVERVLHLRRWSRIPLAGAAALLGAGIAAAVWWPAYLYSALSFRGGAGERGMSLIEVGRYSLGLSDLLTLAWPSAVGTGGASYWGGMLYNDYPRFMGATVVVLAAAAWSLRKTTGSVGFWIAAIAIAHLVALGTRLGPIYEWLHATVPFWSKFRVPSAGLVVGQLGGALLAGLALDRWLTSGVPRPWFGWRPVACALGLLAVLGLLLAVGPLQSLYASIAQGQRPQMSDDVVAAAARAAGLDLAWRVGLIALLLVVLHRASALRRFAAMAVALLVIADVGSATVPFLTRGTGPVTTIESRPPPMLARVGAADHHARVLSTRHTVEDPRIRIDTERNFEFYFNDWITWRARTLGGNHGSLPSVWKLFAGPRLMRSVRIVRALGVTYLSADSGLVLDTTSYIPVSAGGEPVYRLRRALGRAYAVPRVVSPGNDIAVVNAMLRPDYDPAQIALAATPDANGIYPGSSGLVSRWVEDDPDRVTLEVAAPAAAFLVVADSHFPGWQAHLDGRPATIHRVNQLLRGIQIPAGRHRLTMRYEPDGWRPAVALTRGSLALWIALALALGVVPIFGRRGRGAATA